MKKIVTVKINQITIMIWKRKMNQMKGLVNLMTGIFYV